MNGIIVNYVWLQSGKQNPGAIPSHLFYHFQQNARKYGDAEFRLWIQSPNTYKKYVLPSNVVPCSLNKLDSFSTCPALQSRKHDDFWFRVDMSRLLVTQSVLGKNPGATVVYSDFDVPDIGLGSDMLHDRLKKYGVAFGSCFDPTPENLAMKIEERSAEEYENGYMAFTSAAKDLLDSIIETARDSDKTDRHGVYHAIETAFDNWAVKPEIMEHNAFARDWKIWEAEIAGFPVQPPCGSPADETLRAEEMPASRASAKRLHPKGTFKRIKGTHKNALVPAG